MKEIIDRKFKILAVNPCNGKIYTEENAILFRAKDAALLPALQAYFEACSRLLCNPEHLNSIDLLIARVSKYQRNVEIRVPDTNLQCEIERCIEGKNL